MKQLHSFALETILGEVKRLEKEHPKAKVVYNCEQQSIQILYPIPTNMINPLTPYGKTMLENKLLDELDDQPIRR